MTLGFDRSTVMQPISLLVPPGDVETITLLFERKDFQSNRGLRSLLDRLAADRRLPQLKASGMQREQNVSFERTAQRREEGVEDSTGVDSHIRGQSPWRAARIW